MSFHANYRCGRTGACCTAGWPIPVEADRLSALQSALANGALRPAVTTTSPFVWIHDAPAEAPALVALSDHRCVFYESAGGVGGCRIHATLGHDALPQACRQFPRVSVRDPRGVSITLSNYCPTAAALLGSDADVHIRTDAPAFPPHGEFVGLDASSSLPPLLAAGVLMDWESWWEFERLAVETLAHRRSSARESLALLHAIVEDVLTWRPGDESLIERVRQAFALPPSVGTVVDRSEVEQHAARAIAAIPEDVQSWTPPMPPTRHQLADGTTRRFLAAHAFANWSVQIGDGLAAWLRSLDSAYALLEIGFGVRDADLILRHLADPTALATRPT